jgi:hypothetical protein
MTILCTRHPYLSSREVSSRKITVPKSYWIRSMPALRLAKGPSLAPPVSQTEQRDHDRTSLGPEAFA